MAKVPLLKGSISKTPIGPFQTTVLAFFSAFPKRSVVFGPISKPIQPEGISWTDVIRIGAEESIFSAATQSTGRRRSIPFFWAVSIIVLAVTRRSSSTRDLPTSKPLAFKKVKAIPPPMSNLSTRWARFWRTSSFPETLAPPTTAARGRSGFSMILFK